MVNIKGDLADQRAIGVCVSMSDHSPVCFSNGSVWQPWCTDRRLWIASRSSMHVESSR